MPLNCMPALSLVSLSDCSYPSITITRFGGNLRDGKATIICCAKYLGQHLALSEFLYLINLFLIKGHLIVILIFISLITNEVNISGHIYRLVVSF